MGEMAIMDRVAGDLKVIWDPENENEISAAREQFDSLRKKGYMAYTVGERGRKGTQIREFDPSAEKMILAPPLVGG
jgi:hypothetical protein